LRGWWRAGEFDATFVQVVALKPGLVGRGEHLPGDVVAAARDRRLGERDDRHPVIGTELGGGLGKARQSPVGDV
jgi:hypothetical protein